MDDAIFTVPLSTAYAWSLEELYRINDVPFSVRMKSDVTGKVEPVGPQSILLINDLRKIDRDLVHKIQTLQRDPALLAEVRDKMYQDNYQTLLRDNRTRNRDQVRKLATDITDKLLANGVMIGAMRITMRNGEIFTDIFTTYSHEEDNDQIYDSLLRDLYRFKTPDRLWYHVMSIQYFHSHLTASPLTHADFQIAEWLASLAKKRVDRRVPVHIYASFERDGYTVMFHHNR